MRTSSGRVLAGLRLIAALVLLESHVLARQFELDFDSPEATWQVRCREAEARLLSQGRRREGALRERSEFFRIQVTRENTPLRLEHKVPAVRVLDELTASLWYQSERPGAVLAMRISFRGTIDPATNTPLSIIISGDRYETAGKWQQLKCRTADKVVSDQMRLLRARKKVTVDPESMYIDQIIVGCQLAPGTVEMLIDDLELGPIVPANAPSDDSAPSDKVVTASSETSLPPVGAIADSKSPAVPVEFNLHRIRVDGKPFFPRVVPYRQERPEVLADAGFNTTWVADIESISTTGQFRDRGIWLTSTPPFAKGASGEPLDSDDASLLPFTPASSAVLFWMLGIRMTGDSRPRLASWANQIRDADRRFKRPLAADMADDERIASRHLDMIGLSRHVLNTSLSLSNYRDDMIRRRERAWPGTFCFTWIQTEPAPELMDLKQVTDESPVLEPEQIRLQVYAALAAGCRGIGFWTTTPLDGDAPGARERYLTITQLNLELSLLEPWLATGSTVQLIPFTVETNHADSKAKPGVSTSKPQKKTPEMIEAERRREREFSAALIRTESGALLLPMWLEDRAQFVPPQLAAYSATIIVPGAGETATAWEITTTGRVQNLTRETVAGGVKITLQKFDQTAAILVTSDPSTIERINQRIAGIQEHSANATVELCRLKLERVRKIDDQLQQLGIRPGRSAQWLGDARLQYDKAEVSLRQQQYHAARQQAGIAMQMARLVQRTYWDDAVAKLQTPIVSPLATCFQTLPAHWKLMRADRVLDSKAELKMENRLPSGEFEDLDTLIAAGWQRHEQKAAPDTQATAELVATARQGKSALRLAVLPTVPEPAEFEFHSPPVCLVSPAVTAHAGQLMRVTGWVKTPHAITRSLDGALIYDSVLGRTGAVRILNAPEWQRFEMWRPVPESQSMTVHVEMHGLGEILIDDLRITSVSLPADIAEVPRPGDSPIKPAQHTPGERFDFRRLSPLKRKQ